MPESIDKWYYAAGGQRQGPVPLEELRAMIDGGKLQADTLVWSKDMGDQWKPVSGIPELQGSVAATGSKLKLSQPPPEPNPAMAAINAMASTQQTPGAQTQTRIVRPSSGPSPVWRFIKYAFILGILAGGAYYYMTNFYKSKAVKTYEEFAQYLFAWDWEDALGYCDESGSARGKVTAESRLRRHPLSNITQAGKPEIISKSYEVQEQSKSEDGQSVTLMVKQSVRVGISYSPFQARIVNIHTGNLVKIGDDWKINSFSIEFEAAYNPMTGQKMF